MVSKMSSKMVGSNNLAHARRMVQQLRVEASIERIKLFQTCINAFLLLNAKGDIFKNVSKASADLMRYCGENAKYDPLLMGIPASENPFKDKKPCIIL